MRLRSRPRTFRLFERVTDGPRDYVAPPSGCPGCGGIDDDHAPGCPQASRQQVGAHHVGSVNRVLPGEDAALTDEPDADRLSRAHCTLTSRARTVRQLPARSGRASR